ncbi:MAG TPA: DUF5009 domain-containing protein [Sedimentisphaerales bacterium]|nr:DUF5009 domain-containing protein [Sedimentisphaerales bacterium]
MIKDEHAVAPHERILSIDALRGFDMFLIIGGYEIITGFIKAADNRFLNSLLLQTTHAPWRGFHFWDLIMPLFLFIVGVAMPFSFHKRLLRGDSKKQLYFHIIKRFVILFFLGMTAQGHLLEYDLSKLHIYCNTLQAIAAGYLIASIIILNMNIAARIITTAVLLLLFWAVMVLVPVPGSPAGVLTPDGNLAIYIDRLILGRFQDGTHYTWILSSITFACTVMLGTMAGSLLRSQKTPSAKVAYLAAAGFATLVLGLLWNFTFPIIKHLWTSSFVLFSGGICFLLLAGFYLVIDVWRLHKWAFGFVVIGTNAIAVYMATRLFDFRTIGNIFVGGLAESSGPWNDFVSATAGFAVVWLILYWMYRSKSFIKI